jgi:8-amino-7-oxononanoate synthase
VKDVEASLREELEQLKYQSAYRDLHVQESTGGHITVGGQAWLNFSSNDYLELSSHPTVLGRAHEYLERFGAGATASRLVAGDLPCHEELESRLAIDKGYEHALLFGSGFLTNVGVITALVGRNDEVFADRLVHASILDAIRLSGARLQRFQHNDVDHLAFLLGKPSSGRRLVVTESLFSMDGDLAPLEDITMLAERAGALCMVDEAHATGTFGPHGRGLVAELGLQGRVQLAVGTLSKALGGYGGYVACSETMRSYLINRSRPFIYSTGLPPAAVGAALGALDELEAHPEWPSELQARASELREGLRTHGIDTLSSQSQIVPVVAGENETALAWSEAMREVQILSTAIRPPTVPEGQSRLRLSITRAHSKADIDRLIDCIAHLHSGALV